MSSTHALLAPSAAHRWLQCPAATRREATLPDTGSEYAAEGSLAHVCAARAAAPLAAEAPTAAELDREEQELLEQGLAVTQDMRDAAEDWADILRGKLQEARATTPDALLLIERKVTIPQLPQCHGTADAVIVADGILEVVDYKYGKGVRVEADHNAQMMLYALGALAAYSYAYVPDKVQMTIYQPRLGHLSTWGTTARELRTWAKEVAAPAASAALHGGGRGNPGDWCRFCLCRPTCPELAAFCCNVGDDKPSPELMTDKQLAKLALPYVDMVKAWVAAVEQHALKRALDGATLPGYKLVAGRSVRKIADPAALEDALLKAGYAREDITKPRELLTLTALEGVVGRKAFRSSFDGFLARTTPKPALVAITDPRKAWTPAQADFDGIVD